MNQRSNPGGLTRREVVAAGAAGALAAAAGADTPVAAGAARARRGGPARRRADVIVVGAGLAGLTAARDIAARGRSVLVLEARNRVGGRTLNAAIGQGEVVELGGQWVGPGQDRIMALAGSVGVPTFKTYSQGQQILEYNGSRTSFGGVIPPLPTPDAQDFASMLSKLGALTPTVSLEAPWTAPNASAWDAQTLETWKLANTATAGARFLLDLATRAIFAAEPRDLSFLHFLFYANSGGGLLQLASTSGGAQDSRFVGGSQLVSVRVAQHLGRRVVLSAPARRIEWGGAAVRVHSDAGTFVGKRVIVAIPPTLAGRLSYLPPLPAARDGLTQRIPMGSVIKCEAVYDAPFWRGQGLNGYSNSDVSPVAFTYDNSPPTGRPGVLLGFVVGHDARVQASSSAAARRAAVVGAFARLFGPQAASPRQYLEHDWSQEQWTRGCYAGFMPPGVWSDYGAALRPPVGRIHWAGTETATVNNGYMDGAVRSGERAAGEVLAHL